MLRKTRGTLLTFAAALFTLGAAPAATTPASSADECKLNFARANNMWGTSDDALKSLGWETITMQPGQKRAFVTDWRYEKTRNDGQTYYGSHGRRYKNVGTRIVKVARKGATVASSTQVMTFYIDPGQETLGSGDIVEVACP